MVDSEHWPSLSEGSVIRLASFLATVLELFSVGFEFLRDFLFFWGFLCAGFRTVGNWLLMRGARGFWEAFSFTTVTGCLAALLAEVGAVCV